MNIPVTPPTASIRANTPAESGVDREGLQATFELFTRMSDDLAESYRALEAQVAALTQELDRVNRQRDLEIKSREKVSARLSNLLDLLPGGVIVLDRWGVVSQANPAAGELLAIELEGRRWVDVIAECFSPREDDFHEISLKNGRRISLDTRSLEAETGQIILLTDQTETRHLQAEVSRSQRLSALGNMVSAMAHQIRTPLSAALLYASHLGDRQLEPVQIQKFGQKIVARLNQLEQQVSDMLVFARGDVKLVDRTSVDDLIGDIKQSLDVIEQSNQIDVIFDCQHDTESIICNRQILVGAILNLINNAAQASAAGQKVFIGSSIEGDRLCLDIADRGSGIAPDVMERIQAEEAFVSTKSQGTGLGLAVVRAVVKAHKGYFNIVSTEGTGTDIRLMFPLDQASISVDQASMQTIDNNIDNHSSDLALAKDNP